MNQSGLLLITVIGPMMDSKRKRVVIWHRQNPITPIRYVIIQFIAFFRLITALFRKKYLMTLDVECSIMLGKVIIAHYLLMAKLAVVKVIPLLEPRRIKVSFIDCAKYRFFKALFRLFVKNCSTELRVIKEMLSIKSRFQCWKFIAKEFEIC